MSRLVDVLSEYARYHRDPRNLAAHMVGVPMILVGTAALLSRPMLPLEPRLLSPALVVAVVAGMHYLGIQRRMGRAMCVLLAVVVAIGHGLASLGTALWLGSAVGLLVLGWIIQFIGHAWEGRKPAFMDDLRQLLVGPVFVMAEFGFRLGLGEDLRHAIEHRAGRVVRRPSQPRAHHRTGL